MSLAITTLTYGAAIQRICRMVGHPVPADPVGSLDQAVQQMGEAINYALEELLTMHEWQDLTELMTLSVVGAALGDSEVAVALPVDFYRFIDQTQWSNSQMFPAPGPVSPQGWRQYTVWNVEPMMTLAWQMRGDQIWFLAPPYPTAAEFTAFYLSNAQVIDQDVPTEYKNVASKNGDQFKLDSYMVTLLGRARYLEWKGFDSSAATRDFLAVFNSRAGADKGAQTLSLSGPRGLPLISNDNVPATGFGS